MRFWPTVYEMQVGICCVLCLLSFSILTGLPILNMDGHSSFERPVFDGPVPVVNGRRLSSTEFKERYLDWNLPVLIKNGTAEWPMARKPWTDEYLAQAAGDHVLSAEESASARFGHEAKGWARGRIIYRNFLHRYLNSPVNIYIGGKPPLSLAADLHIPLALECILEEKQIAQLVMWHGAGKDNVAGGADGERRRAYNSLLHNDHWENMFFVASGMKKVSLFDSRLASALYENTSKLDKTSPVDIDNPDFQQFPLLREALPHRIDVEVQEGDLLYIPLFWFHQVYTERRTIAVSLWWDAHGLRQRVASEGKGMGSQQLLDALLGANWQRQASLPQGESNASNQSASMKKAVRKKKCPTKRGLLSSASLADLKSCKRGWLCKVPKRRHEQYLSL